MSDKAEEKISYQKSISALFASTSMLAFGALSLLSNFSMDYYSIMVMLSIVIPVTVSMGFIGFVIGKIFDMGEDFHPFSKKKKSSAPTVDNAYKIQSMFSSDAQGTSMFDSNSEEYIDNEAQEDE